MVRNIFKIFARSPFEPLNQHLMKCCDAAFKVPEIIEALKAGDNARVKEIAKEVMRLEHDADEIKHEIRDHVPKTLFLPVDRRDLLHLLSAQDEIADRAEDFAVVITLKHDLTIPPIMLEELERVEGLIMECVKRAKELGEELEELLEAGFAGPEADHIFNLIKELGETEWRADKRQYKLSQLLINDIPDLTPVDLLVWSQIIQNLGKIANAAESYSKEIRNILAK